MNEHKDNKSLVWHTHLSLNECVSRMEKSVDTRRISSLFLPFNIFALFGKKSVRGSIGESEIRLEKIRWYHDDFGSALDIKLKADPQGGTTIEGSISSSEKWLIGLMIVIMLVFSVMALFGNLKFKSHYGLPVPIEMAISLYIIYKVHWWLDRKEQSYLANFVQQTLEATPVTNNVQDMLWR